MSENHLRIERDLIYVDGDWQSAFSRILEDLAEQTQPSPLVLAPAGRKGAHYKATGYLRDYTVVEGAGGGFTFSGTLRIVGPVSVVPGDIHWVSAGGAARTRLVRTYKAF